MAAAYENLSLGWRRSSMDIGFLRQRQSSSVILRYLPSATKTAMNTKLRCRSAATEEEAAANTDIFSVTPSSMADFDYLGQSTKGDLNLNLAINGEAGLDGPIEDVAKMEAREAERLLNHLGIPDPFSARHSPSGIFCSRTLNLRSISAIGYDMDYILVHYNVVA